MRIFTCLALILVTACGSDEVDSDEQARRAYLGLDASIEKSIALGFQGFNLSSNANIDDQTTAGGAGGTLTVGGKVDSGSSTNKGMRLYVGMVDYDEGPVVVNNDGHTVRVIYNTAADQANQPYFNLQLKNFPTGTLEGTLSANASMLGVYVLSGDIKGELTLDLTIAGTTMAGPNDTVIRVPGATTVTGTATNSDGGVYDINLTI
jgi:hypothetical protein